MGNAGFDQTGNGFYRIAETAFFHSVYISFPVFIKIKNIITGPQSTWIDSSRIHVLFIYLFYPKQK